MRILALFISLLFPLSTTAQDRYRVTFDSDLAQVTVRGCFEGELPAYLRLNHRAPDHIAWIRSTDRKILTIPSGNRLSLAGLPADSCVEWQIDLESALRANDYRLAVRLNDALLLPGDLWFWRDDERRDMRVEVALPESMSLSVPWHLDEEEKVYIPQPTPASWSSRTAIGHFPLRHVSVGNSVLRIALLGELDESMQDRLTDWAVESASAVASVYGRFPRDSVQVVIAAIGRQGEAVPWAHVVRGGGPAVEFFVDQTRSAAEFSADWTATHEFSHLLLPLVSSRDRWLSEGLASYYQNVLRARDGRLSETEAWEKLESGFERGRRATRGGSLANATRSGRGAIMRIYWSGAAMMLKADSRLRAESGGRQSLDSALAGLHECCLRAGRSWSAKALMRQLDEITGHEIFSDVYREHVWDSDFPDLEATYEQLGVVHGWRTVQLDPQAPWGRIRYYIMNTSPSTLSAGSR